MEAVQMNVRMGQELKSSGDSVFASIGYTPTEVVRRVWEFANRNRSNRTAVTELMEQLRDPAEVQQEQNDNNARNAEAEAWLDDLCEPIREYCEQFGIDINNIPPIKTNELFQDLNDDSYSEEELLLTMHYIEKYPELWS